MKKFLSVILAVCLIAALFSVCGCGKNSTTEEATQDEISNGERLVYVSSNDMKFGENVVAKTGDYEITLDELNVFIGALVSYIQNQTGSDEGWEDIIVEDGKTAREVLIQYALEEAKYQHFFLTSAMEDGYYTSSDDEAFYQEYIESSGGREEYEAFLSEYGFTDEAFRKYISATGAFYAVGSEENAVKKYNDEYITAKHILITFDGRETEEAAYDEAMAAYNRAAGGESFEALITELNEDPGENAETGYTFGEGEMVDEFYQGAKALKVGEISKPVKTTYGYHVIKRYPLAEKGTEAYESSISNIMGSIASDYGNSDKMNELIEKNTLYVNEDILNKIDLSMYTTSGSSDSAE